MRKQYVYSPGFMDLCDPTVLRGTAIQRGALVTISRKERPFMMPSCFVVIQDTNGNTQSVWKRALQPVEGRR